jgi:hypothetical protein
MKTSKRARTARGSRSRVEPGLVEPPEEGLSVDADELGPSFLRYATEQANFETARATPLELAPSVGPASDDPPRGPTATASNLWERTVDGVLASQNAVDPEQPQPMEPGDEESQERDSPEPRRGVAQIDLNASVIEEGTLLDVEGEELGEVIPADPATEDTGPSTRVRPVRARE